MHRREFFQASLIASLAARVLGDSALARAQQTPAAPASAAPPPTPRPLVLDAYSRCLHWVRTPDDVAEAAIEMTCGGVQPTVQAYPGHIDPAKVTTELPAFVNTMKKHGLRVKQVRGGNQTQVDGSVEALVGTMGQVGATHYWLGTDNYDMTKPILPQLDAIKTKVDQFVKLNQKHGMTLMYHTRAGANSVGSVVWDLLYVLKDFDPKHVGLHWDTGHMAHHGAMWETLMRTAGPYVVAVSWKDRTWQQNLGFLGEGGPYPGPVPAGGAAPAAGGRGAGGGRGGGRAAGAPPGAAAGGRAGDPAAALGEFGPPAAGGRGGGRGRGGPVDLANMARPLAGTAFARGGGWSSPSVPMGTGLVDIFRYAAVLRDIGFNGPMELEAEYPNGGVESGADKLTLPRAMVLGALKRDVLTIRYALAQSGTGLTI
jgi:hypothetical protein